MQERGVTVQIITPGHKSDHILTRSSSRRLYGPLLQAGALIYEYEPAMIHTKVLTIDGLWSVVGSTNFDNRSFGINDEVNLAVRDPDFAARLDTDFQKDKAQARHVNFDVWQKRPVLERVTEWAGRLIQRQQ
jgi:cardiolipin synthase